MTTQNTYKVEEFNKGTLFAVTSDNDIHGNYYKTRKAAEKHLQKVRGWAGVN